MSDVGGAGPGGVGTDVRGGGRARGVRVKYSEIQCIMDNSQMTLCEQTDRQARLKTLPSRNFAGGR